MSDIIFQRRGGLAVVTLNRPAALNALTFEMCLELDSRLAAWERDDEVAAVFIKGTGEKAFCAGGDVMAIYEAGTSGGSLTAEFFAAEYRLNRRIHHFRKPHIALIDGIVMGGGCGVSLHGSHRIATERTLFAMPETGIGLFPDVGGTWFLNRCPGRIGLYLGLTGARLKSADLVALGLCTSAIASVQGEELEERLAALDWSSGNASDLTDAVIAPLSIAGEPAPIEAHRSTIDRCFDAASVEAIVGKLERDGGAFAAETLKTLSQKAPASLKAAFRQLTGGKDLDFDAAMVIEYRISQACLAAPDFYEGIRALLIDKDKNPKWQPGSLAEVAEDFVDRYFEEPTVGDLTFSD